MTHPQTNSFLTPATALIINMNAMIGAGIFAVPLTLYAACGPIGILTSLAVTMGMWSVAHCFAAIASTADRKGSFYYYVAPWAGHTSGVALTCLYLLGMIVALALITKTTGQALLAIASPLTLDSVTDQHYAQIAGSLTYLCMALLVAAGVSTSAWLQRLIMCTTLLPLIAIILLCFLHGSCNNLTPFAPYGILPALQATRIVIFGFFGLECATTLAPLLKEPRRSLPFIVPSSVLMVGILYTLFVGAILLVLHPALLQGATQTTPTSAPSLTEILGLLFPQHIWLLTAIKVGILSALFGTLHAMIWSATHLMTSIAQLTRQAPLTSLNGRLMLLSTVVILLSICLHDLNSFFNMTAFCVVTTYFLCIITLFKEKQAYALTTRITGILGLITTAIISLCALTNFLYPGT